MPTDPRRLDEWLARAPEQLAERSPVPFLLVDPARSSTGASPTTSSASSRLPRARRGSLADRPAGADGAVPHAGPRINEAGLGLAHVTFFGMDEWLDWQGRALPLAHPYSLEGAFRRDFLALSSRACAPPTRT